MPSPHPEPVAEPVAPGRRRLLILAVLLTGLVVAAMATRWQFQAIAAKAAGRLPEASWARVLTLPVAPIWTDAGFVRLGETTADACCCRWDTPVGSIWGDHNDGTLEMLFHEQLVDRSYDNEVIAVQPGDTVLDIGAHLGTFTRFALNRGAARVVMVEPDRVFVPCLARTFASEIAAGQVVLVPAAAWHSAGTLNFGEYDVPAVTIDGVVESLSLGRVDFIKMDIEGAELDALQGALATVGRDAPRMSVEIHDPTFATELPRLIGTVQPGYSVAARDAYLYFVPTTTTTPPQ